MKKIGKSVLTESKTAPRAFVGRSIHALTLEEKNNPLIAKLLKRIQKPSAQEFNSLANIKIFVHRGRCLAFTKQGEKLQKVRIFNLGTEETPAFFYHKYIFVLDKKTDSFVPTGIKVVYFNDAYVLGSIADNLFFCFDVKGLSPMGNIKSVHVLPGAYLVTTIILRGKTAVYGFASVAQKLFTANDSSYFEITDNGVNTKSEDGCIEEMYMLQEGKFVCL